MTLAIRKVVPTTSLDTLLLRPLKECCSASMAFTLIEMVKEFLTTIVGNQNPCVASLIRKVSTPSFHCLRD